MPTKMQKTKSLLRTFQILVTVMMLSSCVPQMVLNYALKRDEQADAKRYENDMQRYRARHTAWAEALHDTTMLSPNNGKTLHALYIAAPRPTASTVFLMHGYTGSSATMLNMARFYNEELGCNVFMPDFYAHGKSQGRMRQMGWLDRLDMLQWMQMANRIFRLNGQDTKMLVTGVSMGGATTMMVSGDVEERGLTFVKCFVEDCGYTTVYDQFSDVVKGRYTLFLRWANHRCRRKYGWDFHEASALSQVARCSLPMLFIHGGHDTYVPTRMVDEVYAAKQGERELWVPEGIEHARSFTGRNAEYKRRVKEFAQKYIL